MLMDELRDYDFAIYKAVMSIVDSWLEELLEQPQAKRRLEDLLYDRDVIETNLMEIDDGKVFHFVCDFADDFEITMPDKVVMNELPGWFEGTGSYMAHQCAISIVIEALDGMPTTAYLGLIPSRYECVSLIVGEREYFLLGDPSHIIESERSSL